MKLPRNLYSRLTLMTCVALVTGYLIVTAAWVSMGNVGTGDQLSAELWNTLVGNVNDLNTRISSFSFVGGNVGIGTSPDADYKLNVNGKIKGAGTTEAWSVKNTGSVGQVDSWTAIPGLSATFTLSRPAMVHLTSWGVQRFEAGSYCHVGYRYVVDDIPRGHASWWQHIQVSSSATWHAGWTMIEAENLAAGTHTIRIEATNNSTTNWCRICAEAGGGLELYDSCTMNISAFYQ